MDERFHLGVVIEFSRISLQKTSLTLIHSLIFFCFSAVEKTRSSKKFKSQKLFHLVHTISSIYWEEKKTRSIRRYLCSILWITMRKRKETREGERERKKFFLFFGWIFGFFCRQKVFWCIVAHVLCLSYAKKLWWSNTTLKSSSVLLVAWEWVMCGAVGHKSVSKSYKQVASLCFIEQT